MPWSDKLGVLRRGIRLVGRVAKAQIPILRAIPAMTPPMMPGRLVENGTFGPNPGQLKMMMHVPGGQPAPNRPLIVLLHGCGQTAGGFARDSGWIDLSDRLGIPLILPEQMKVDNSGRCFRWFQPTETMRGSGEAASIAAMTRAAMGQFQSDPARVFIAGLSAGGAMAAALLAGYPDLYAAGAVVAGLPVGSADSPMLGLLRMAHAAPERRPGYWADQVRHVAPSGYAGPWPRLSVWHGDADETVVPANGEMLASQWAALLGHSEVPERDDIVPGGRHRVWGDAVELWTLSGTGHGYPVGGGLGRAAPFMLDCGLAATPRIAAFWHLT